MMPTIADAILKINPSAQVVVRGENLDTCTIEWFQGTEEISKADIKTKLDELQAEYDAQDYARKRKDEYPSIEECVHAILDDTLTELQTKRAEIKLKHPKPDA